MNRDQVFTLWFSEEEKAGLQRLAYAEGLSMSDVLRRLLLFAVRDSVGVSDSAQEVLKSGRGEPK